MGAIDFDISAFEDPAPADVNNDAPVKDPEREDSDSQSEEDHEAQIQSTTNRKRKLPYRAGISLEGRKYKGRRVSRGDAELDQATMGIITGDADDHGRVASDVESIDGSVRDGLSDSDGDIVDPKNVESRLEQLEKGEKEVALRLASVDKKEARKAKAVRKQKGLYDAVLDMRIRLEPLVSLARKFPSVEQRKESDEWNGLEDLTDMVAGVEKSMSSLMKSTLQAWKSSWPGVESDDEHDDGRFDSWRNSILDLWGKKVNEAEGLVPKGGFKTIDTTVTAQMKAALGTGKHLSRSRKVRESITLVGCDVEMVEGSEDIHYDDGEFYRTLLREIIENGDGEGGGLRYAQLSKAGKVKKKIDRKASKGRRLRYNVHEKLVGFLAPVPLPDAGPVDEIVAGLFGNRR